MAAHHVVFRLYAFLGPFYLSFFLFFLNLLSSFFAPVLRFTSLFPLVSPPLVLKSEARLNTARPPSAAYHNLPLVGRSIVLWTHMPFSDGSHCCCSLDSQTKQAATECGVAAFMSSVNSTSNLMCILSIPFVLLQHSLSQDRVCLW